MCASIQSCCGLFWHTSSPRSTESVESYEVLPRSKFCQRGQQASTCKGRIIGLQTFQPEAFKSVAPDGAWLEGRFIGRPQPSDSSRPWVSPHLIPWRPPGDDVVREAVVVRQVDRETHRHDGGGRVDRLWAPHAVQELTLAAVGLCNATARLRVRSCTQGHSSARKNGRGAEGKTRSFVARTLFYAAFLVWCLVCAECSQPSSMLPSPSRTQNNAKRTFGRVLDGEDAAEEGLLVVARIAEVSHDHAELSRVFETQRVAQDPAKKRSPTHFGMLRKPDSPHMGKPCTACFPPSPLRIRPSFLANPTPSSPLQLTLPHPFTFTNTHFLPLHRFTFPWLTNPKDPLLSPPIPHPTLPDPSPQTPPR